MSNAMNESQVGGAGSADDVAAEFNEARAEEGLSAPTGLHTTVADGEVPFDFGAHRQEAIESYQPLLSLYREFAYAVHSILKTCLANEKIKVHSNEYRAKTIDSFGDKSATPSEGNPNRPKYEHPVSQITDLAGVRIITYFLSTEEGIDQIIGSQFDVVEKTDRSELLQQEERLGYHSVHYLVKLKASRRGLPEYARFGDLIAEIQVRTILQHAWAEIEHDIQYKSATALPKEIRRRFMTLAGLLEVADREFQAIQESSSRLQEEARASVQEGRLSDVEITPDALKAYLDKKLSPDGRMTAFSYEWMARRLARLSFTDLSQLDAALAPYDDDRVSRAVHGSRQGQLTRLDDVLLAAMGDDYARLSGIDDAWYHSWVAKRLTSIRAAGIPVGQFRPTPNTT